MAVTIMADIEENLNILNIIDLTKYSTLIHVVRVTALLVLFAQESGKHLKCIMITSSPQKKCWKQEICY